LPLLTGPTAQLSPAEWGDYILSSRDYGLFDRLSAIRLAATTSVRDQHAAQLVGALVLYQAELGKLPDDVGELVGRGYLQAIPVDPFSGKLFQYHKTGIRNELPVIWGAQLWPSRGWHLPVPVWNKPK
jgi:hypothetical protein